MTIEERLETLERGLSAAKRRNRYLLIGLVVLGIAWAGTITTGCVQTQTGDKAIRTEKIEVVDSQGRVRASLGVADGGPALAMYDEKGKPRAGLVVTEKVPGLFLYDENGKLRASLGVADDGPGLLLRDLNGKTIWSAP
jgi:hypothetical protein